MTAQDEAQSFLQSAVDAALAAAPPLAAFAERLLNTCAIRLSDSLDYLGVPRGETAHARLGWTRVAPGLWRNGGLPAVVERGAPGVAFRVERLERLLPALGLDAPIEGAVGAPLRRVKLAPCGDGSTIEFVERNGSVEYSDSATAVGARKLRRALIHQQIFRTRRRHFRAIENAYHFTERLVDAAVADLGPAWACSLFLRAEREYWLSRCEAGMHQKRRQDRAGVGWCTLDHIVYSSSREHFHRTLGVFQRLGYQPSQLIRNARQPGLGAQVLEHHSCAHPPILIELDLTGEPDPCAAPMAPLTWHGRAGLWCALHGEALLEGGAARFAARYDLNVLQDLARRDGVDLAAAFADTPTLRQRVTHGQLQAVSPARIDVLERDGHLARSDAETLRLNGAVATHLQAVERTMGHAGFVAPDITHPAFGGDPAPNDLPGPFARRTPMRTKRRRTGR